jgi:hypothetical protein
VSTGQPWQACCSVCMSDTVTVSNTTSEGSGPSRRGRLADTGALTHTCVLCCTAACPYLPVRVVCAQPAARDGTGQTPTSPLTSCQIDRQAWFASRCLGSIAINYPNPRRGDPCRCTARMHRCTSAPTQLIPRNSCSQYVHRPTQNRLYTMTPEPTCCRCQKCLHSRMHTATTVHENTAIPRAASNTQQSQSPLQAVLSLNNRRTCLQCGPQQRLTHQPLTARPPSNPPKREGLLLVASQPPNTLSCPFPSATTQTMRNCLPTAPPNPACPLAPSTQLSQPRTAACCWAPSPQFPCPLAPNTTAL